MSQLIDWAWEATKKKTCRRWWQTSDKNPWTGNDNWIMIRRACTQPSNRFQWTQKSFFCWRFVSHSRTQSRSIIHMHDVLTSPVGSGLSEISRSVQLIKHKSSTKNHYTMFLFFSRAATHGEGARKNSYYSCFLLNNVRHTKQPTDKKRVKVVSLLLLFMNRAMIH